MEPEKRTWIYCQQPSAYEIEGCACGNTDTEWSEFRRMLWCAKCKIDFIPKHYGVFDGPIPVKVDELMGMCFDRIDIESGEVTSGLP